jgi:hypothetical protein
MSLMLVWSTPLDFPSDVANACTNVQQVTEEEEDTTHVDTWHNAKVWFDFFGGLH